MNGAEKGTAIKRLAPFLGGLTAQADHIFGSAEGGSFPPEAIIQEFGVVLKANFMTPARIYPSPLQGEPG
jgi:hypothetical protein